MAYETNGIRTNLKSALMAGIGYTGNLSIQLEMVDEEDLKFAADVEYTTGNATTAKVKITPANEDGSKKVFSSLDDLVKWCNAAFKTGKTMQMSLPDISVLDKPFILPANPVADATRQKTGWVKAKEKSATVLAKLQLIKQQQEGLNYNKPEANILAQEAYAETVAQIAAVQSFIAYYDSEITRLNAIINVV